MNLIIIIKLSEFRRLKRQPDVLHQLASKRASAHQEQPRLGKLLLKLPAQDGRSDGGRGVFDSARP